MKKKIRLGVLFGGRSGEHEVSLTSAASVMKALDPAKYELVPVGITREGRWRVGPRAFGLLTEAAGDDAAQRTASLQTVLEEGRAVTPSVDPTGPKLLPWPSHPLLQMLARKWTSYFPYSTAPLGRMELFRDYSSSQTFLTWAQESWLPLRAWIKTS